MSDLLVELRKTEGETAAKASADVTLQTDFGELTIARIKVIHQVGKKPWIAMPDIRYRDSETDEYKSLKVILPGARLKKIISDAILEKYAEAGDESL